MFRGLPNLNDDGRDGTLFGQRVSAEFVMVLIAKLGGRAEVNMWQELKALRAAGVQIIAVPKGNLFETDVYELRDRDGRPWPPRADESVTVTVTQEQPDTSTLKMIEMATSGDYAAEIVDVELEEEE